ncbi:MAG: hypothetical protein LAN71_10565 [Acidobacteriia bacterium]|nr:hypothetical protein [Terriglobia bacterium]
MQRNHKLFSPVWWLVNLLLLCAVAALLCTSLWEFSVRSYLDGFSDAIVPDDAPAEQKVDYILAWMKSGPVHSALPSPGGFSQRNPEVTLNYQELLRICGTATNAFLNLARSSDLKSRRLLLLSPNRSAKHVVAEVLIDGRWVIADPAYHTLFRDASGQLLTRQQMKDPNIWRQATSVVPGYPSEYTYESFAHVRLGRLPLLGQNLRRILDFISPRWDELIDWSLILERESFAMLLLSIFAVVFLLALRILLGWYADCRLHVPRLHLRHLLFLAGHALFSRPETR